MQCHEPGLALACTKCSYTQGVGMVLQSLVILQITRVWDLNVKFQTDLQTEEAGNGVLILLSSSTDAAAHVEL